MKTLTMVLAITLSTSIFAQMKKVPNFGSNPGNLTMYQHIPQKEQVKMPLVIVLHGCTQSAAEFQQRSGWSKLANEHKFAVIYPEQKSSNNPMMCFTWGERTSLTRNKGEGKSIVDMINKVKEGYSIDENRIFITGFSAGAALAANMLALYPDIFKAGSIMAGIPYHCASDLSESFACMFQGKVKTAQQWGDLVRRAFTYNGTYPNISIWHGSKDYTVSPVNATELVKQWGEIHGVSGNATNVDLNDNNEHSFYMNAAGKKVIHLHKMPTMGHAITVDPNTDFTGGSTGAYSENHGTHSTYVTALEWGLLQ